MVTLNAKRLNAFVERLEKIATIDHQVKAALTPGRLDWIGLGVEIRRQQRPLNVRPDRKGRCRRNRPDIPEKLGHQVRVVIFVSHNGRRDYNPALKLVHEVASVTREDHARGL